VTRLRRASQIVWLALFVFHVYNTEYRGSLHAGGGEIRLPFPARLLLDFDPLIAIANALATRSLYQGLLWSLTILIPTFFLGRFFCGWMCPLGTLNHFFSSLKSERKRGRQLIESNRYKRWQGLKYYILIAVLVAALLGSGVLQILDPLSLAVRSLAASILPAANYGVNALLGVLGQNAVLRPLADGLDIVLRHVVLSFRQPYFRQGFFLGLIFITILALNFRITRFWCRALCPLGALLGLMSRWSILGLEKQAAHCEECNRCLLHCQGGDDPIPGVPWRKSECHLCFNCVDDCPESGIRFRFFPATPTTVDGPNLQRRKALTSLAAGAAMLPLLRATTGLAAERHERLLRPPGALDEKHFLERCIRCGECLKVCPNNALQPALVEAGLEGIWTPVLVPRIGYCEPSCTLCGQVCPTGAIWEVTAKEKAWAAENVTRDAMPIRVGTAFYDRGRCLPWSMATECIVCEEWCPTSPKAIYLRPAEAVDAQGNIKQVRQPYVDPARCVGCGACEFACPVKDRPAVYVTSVGESRSTTNQILLRSPRKGLA
jgi:polyferredoxin